MNIDTDILIFCVCFLRNRGDSCVNVQMYFSSFFSLLDFIWLARLFDLLLLNALLTFSLVSCLTFSLNTYIDNYFTKILKNLYEKFQVRHIKS